MGKIIPLKKDNHPYWKGGVSSLQETTRGKLYHSWSYQKIKSANFVCQKCSNSFKLQVHHDKEKFAEIIQKSLKQFNISDVTKISFEEKKELENWIVNYHIENNVSGIVLCENCHKLEHKKK